MLDAGATAEGAALAAADADVVLVGIMPFGGAEIAILRQPGLLIRCGTGYDNIDVTAATAAGIWVSNVPDYCLDEVADHAILLLLASWRRLTHFAQVWRTEDWRTSALPPVQRISRGRLGIVGLGRIGRRVADRAAAFGWSISYTDPYVVTSEFLQVDLPTLFRSCHAITLHCPLNDDTHHLVGDALLASVGPNSILVNTSRGPLVDLDGLERAFASGRIGAAALDVLDDEPQPNLQHPLFRRREVLVTPHIAWYSIEAKRDLALLAATEALRYLNGETPRNLVNRAARSTLRR